MEEEVFGLMEDRKWTERRKELGTRYNLQRQDPSDILTLARTHLLKFPSSPKIPLPAGEPVVDISYSNHR
jgi:hypothetical protein